MGLKELVHKPTIIFADNKTANDWVTEDKVTAGNMWILQSYHYAKEMAEGGENLIRVKYVRSCYNLADVFTKAVTRDTLKALYPYLTGQLSIAALMAQILEDHQKSESGQTSTDTKSSTH